MAELEKNLRGKSWRWTRLWFPSGRERLFCPYVRAKSRDCWG